MLWVMVAGWAVVAGAAPAAAEPQARPEIEADRLGSFVVSTARRSSSVEGGPSDASALALIARELTLGPNLVWLDGTSCASWSAARTPSPTVDLEDPNLSDLRIGPENSPTSFGDQSVDIGLEISCEGRVLGRLTVVDDRVLVATSPSGLSHLILERPVTEAEIRRLQAALSSMKFYSGEVTGAWSPALQRALGYYAEYRGSRYRFERVAMTRNLLDGTRVLDPPAWAGPEIRSVRGPGVEAHFWGRESTSEGQAADVRKLTFSFRDRAGGESSIPYRTLGRPNPADWNFDVFSPDGEWTLLPEGNRGGFHVVASGQLSAYLRGERGPDAFARCAAADGASAAPRWASARELEWPDVCGIDTVWSLPPASSGSSSIPEQPGETELLKTVHFDGFAAHFYGVRRPLEPLESGIRSLAFSFEGDPELYPFRPEGTPAYDGWILDEIYRHEPAAILLQQDEGGPYHVARAADLLAYLRGEAGPFRVSRPTCGRQDARLTRARWIGPSAFEYLERCGGIEIWRRHYLAPVLDLGPSGGVSIEAYRPDLTERLADLPAVEDASLRAALGTLEALVAAASADPGSWQDGPLALGADPRQYIPSDAELLAARLGDRITARLATVEGGPSPAARSTDQVSALEYTRFDFRRVEAMGSGLHVWASPPQNVRVEW